MGTVANLIANWHGSNKDKTLFYSEYPTLVLRWVNGAQDRFANLSESLKDVWTPTIDDEGTADLPDDFLREVPNRVKWSQTVFLQKGDYATLSIANLSTTVAYAIWGNTFYVFAPSAGEPSIPYIKKPEDIALLQINTADLEVTSENQFDLINFLDAMWERQVGNLQASMVMMKDFERGIQEAGERQRSRNDPVPRMVGGMF